MMIKDINVKMRIVIMGILNWKEKKTLKLVFDIEKKKPQ